MPQRVTMATAILHQKRPTMTTLSEAVEIYCVKCKARTASKDIEAVTMKNGRPATRAICVECCTRKFRIGVLPLTISAFNFMAPASAASRHSP